jgi:hypothetical protein
MGVVDSRHASAVGISFYPRDAVCADLKFHGCFPALPSRRASRLALSLSRRLLSALRSEGAMTRSLSTANPTARFKQGFLRVLNF